MAFNSNGILVKAESATRDYGKAKAHETLELALSDAQIQQYNEGLTDEQLNQKIIEIEGELLPKENEDSNHQQVIVDGYIFEIDRDTLKIIDCVGEADGIIITAMVSNNDTDGWVSAAASKANITGRIKTYSGGTITATNARIGSTTIPFSIDSTGKYVIDNIKESGTYTIYAEDSKGKNKTKEIEVTVKIDKTAPTFSNVMAEAVREKIKISATATDSESGINRINYSVKPSTVSPASGTLESGKEIELTSTEATTYTITFTAIDNAQNRETQTATVTTTNGMGIGELKEKVTSYETLKTYIGTKVDYQPSGDTTGVYRLFYYDADNYFGDGVGTIYLKRDCDDNLKRSLQTTVSDAGIAQMKKMNPLWAASSNADSVDLDNEKAVSWMCDSARWTNYCDDSVADYAIAGPSVEMFMRAYNVWMSGTPTATDLICEIGNMYGYKVGANGVYKYPYTETPRNSVYLGPEFVFGANGVLWYLSSPLCMEHHVVGIYTVNYTDVSGNWYSNENWISPLVCLK